MTDTLNILSLWPEQLFRTKQSPSRRVVLRALAARPDVILHQTGPRFPDWHENESGFQNVRRIMPDCDAVIGYKLVTGEKDAVRFGVVRGLEELSRDVLLLETFNECHSGTPGNEAGELHPGCRTVVDYARQAHLKLLIHHHFNDLPRIEAAREFGCRLVHIPHGADPLFAEESRPWSERSGVLLTGAINKFHYPLRWRIFEMVQSGVLKGQYLPRPSNYTDSVASSDALVREYARALGRCKIKLGCSSRWRYALQHYSEAALAGCCHVADMPEGVADDFKDMLVPIDPNCSDASLIATVQALEGSAEYAEKLAAKSQATAQAGYTTAHYAERLVTAIRECLAEM